MAAAQNDKSIYAQTGIFLLSLAATGGIFFLVRIITKDGETRYLIALILIPFLLMVIHPRTLSVIQKSALLGVMLATAIIFALPILIIMYENVIDPPAWDFHPYWIYGQAIDEGLSPYQYEDRIIIARSLEPVKDILQTANFLYMPPALFMFAPLGWFDVNTAYAVWYAAHSIVLFLVVVLLWKTFWADSGFMGFLLSGTLVLMFYPVLSTISVGQVNFLLFLFLLLFIRDQNSPRAGIWLALAVFSKPFAVILLLYPLLKRRWQTILYMMLTIGFAFLLTRLVFGSKIIMDYFESNPFSSNAPFYYYTESINQSLLANILRWTHVNEGTPVFRPIFIIAALVLAISTSALIFMSDDRWSEWMFVLTIALALLIFPATLTHYSFLLFALIFLLISRYKELPGGWWFAVTLTVMLFFLVQFERLNFYAYVISWLTLMGIGIKFLTDTSDRNTNQI